MIEMHINRFNFQLALAIMAMTYACALFAQQGNELGLSSAEQEWLNNHPTIRLAVDIAWPPFEWVDKDMEYKGIAADYMQLVGEKLGVRFEVEKNKQWPQAVAALKEHKLDVFTCVAKNKQRQEYVNFTRPYLSFPMVIVTSSDVNYIDGMKGLKGLVVGVVKGYATHEYMEANHPEIKLNIVTTSEEGLESVSQGRVDAFVDNIATATSIIQSRGLTNLKISGEMPVRYELSMAVRKDWPELIDILQQALDSISEEQRKKIHNKWIGVRYEHGFDYSLFWKSLFVFALIISVMYFYNRRLVREVSQRKLAEIAAIEALGKADKANKSKSEFLSVVSHELRTPLTSIKGAIGLLTGGEVIKTPEQAHKMLNIADANCDRLIILINDILDIEKLLANKMSFYKDDLAVGVLIRQAAKENQGYANQYKVHIDIEMKDCASIVIHADKNRLIQVLSNFLSNAIKYSPEEGHVCITAQCEYNKVRISVIDQGKGVPADFQGSMFMHFSQADSSDAREKGGTGLGLAISKEIVEHHGGTIGFISPPGEGATFYFELEVNQAKK